MKYPERDAAHALAAIIESSNDAIYSKDANALIRSWNPAAEELYGYSADEAIGRHVSMLVPEDRKGEDQDILEKIMRGERVDHLETQRVTKDGRIVDVSITISPVRDADDNIVEASVIGRDISARKKGEEAIVAAREARAKNEAIQEFVAMATHDLRTPLSVITGMAATLRERWSDVPDDRRLELLAAIERNGIQMARLVNDLLMLTRAEADELRPDKQTVEMAPFLRDLIGTLQFEVALAFPPEEISVEADPDHLQRIITNLIVNADKHGEPPIELSASQGPDWVEFKVTDSGPGIPDELVPKIFMKFARGSGRGERDTGLGLAIARSLARANGGEAWYEPQPTGSRFCVRLPAAPTSG